MAFGRVAGCPRHGVGRFTRVDMWNDNPLDTAVEITQDGWVFVIGDAGDGGNTKDFSGTYHMFDVIEVHGAVLAINHHKIVANRTKELDEIRRVTTDNGAKNNFPVCQFSFSRVGLHAKFLTPPRIASDCHL